MSTQIPTVKELFRVGAHFGHHRERTDARTHPYVFGYKNKISIINLERTREMIEKAVKLLEETASKGGKFLFVGTKIQAKQKIKEVAEALGQSYVIERWPGGLLTNYQEVSKSINKMKKTEEDIANNKYEHLTKRERLEIDRSLRKTEVIFGGLKKLEKKPDVMIIVDAKEEMNALLEAKKAGLRVIALCDTNSNPTIIDLPVILNDDSKSTIELVLGLFAETIKKNYKEPVIESKEEIEERIEKAVEAKETKADKKVKKSK